MSNVFENQYVSGKQYDVRVEQLNFRVEESYFEDYVSSVAPCFYWLLSGRMLGQCCDGGESG